MAFGANKGTWLFGANSIVANNQATLSTGSAVVAKGDLIVVVIGEVVANTSSGASDTLGNTYTAITAGTLVGATVSGRAFYTIVTNPGTNTNINVQATASSNNVAIVAASYEGSFSAIDKQPANNNNTDNSSPFTCPATGTLAQQLELIVAWMVDNTANVKSATSPNIKANQQSQTTVSSVLGSQVVNVTTTVSPAFTGTNPTASIQGTASFRAADLPENQAYWPLTPWPKYDEALRTWAAPPPNTLTGAQAPFSQENWPVPVGPYYPNQLRVWSVRGPAYEVVTPPVEPPATTDTIRAPHFSPPRLPLQPVYHLHQNPTIWLASVLPPGEISTALPSKAHEHHVGLRAWAGAIHPALVLTAALPPGEISTALPPRFLEPHIGLRARAGAIPPPPVLAAELPPGTIHIDLPPKGREYPNQLRVWSVRGPVYVPVVPPAARPVVQTDWPVPRGYEFSINLRTWTASPKPVTVVVVVEDAVFRTPHFSPPRAPEQLAPSLFVNPLTLRAAIQAPFKPLDWSLTKAAPPLPQSWTASFNRNLTGQDRLPTGDAISDLPPQPPLSAIQLRTWINTVNLALNAAPVVRPFVQSDWPLNTGPSQPTTIFTTFFNPNLISQDALPVGEIVTDLVPREALRANDLRTWIQTVNLTLTVQAAAKPFAQYDWPVPRAADRPIDILAKGFNLNLVGQDRLPFRQTDWPLPTPFAREPSLASWIDRTKLLLAVPLRQSDWPLASGPIQTNRGFTISFPRVLIGADALPFRQNSWPLPDRGPVPAAFSWTYQTNVPTPTVGTPLRPVDMSLPLAAAYPNDLRSLFTNRVIYGGEVTPGVVTTRNFPFIANVGTLMNRS